MFQDYINICENVLLRHEELKGDKPRQENFTEICKERLKQMFGFGKYF